MLSSIAVVSILATAALAATSTASASSSAASASSTANPLIPTAISSSCSAYLKTLNSDSDITTCLSALSNATSAFAPGSTSASSAAVTSALNNLCTDSVASACSDSLIRTQITAFYAACTAELTSNNNEDVVKMYDVLYILSPLRTSVCSKDDSGSWCAMAATTSTREVAEDVDGDSSMGLADLMALLYSDNSALRRRATVSAIVPNITTYHDTNLPFLFFEPTMDTSKLCTTCARNVLTAYINFESNVPYAPGLGQSLLLDTQSDLYNGITEKCGASFLSGAVQAAGGLKSGTLSSGATTKSEYQSIFAIAMGLFTLAVSAAL